MQITLESLDDITLRLCGTISVNALDEALVRQLNEFTKDPSYIKHLKSKRKSEKIEVFLAGKTPQDLIKECYDEIVPIALDKLVRGSLYEVLAQRSLSPVGKVKLELGNFEFGKPFEFFATFQILPMIDVTYNLAGIQKEIIPVTEKDVAESLQRLQALHVIWAEKNSEALLGDQVIINFKSMIDGEFLKEGEAENYPVVLGSHTMMPGFENGLVGATPNETRILNLVFPEDYFDQAVAGKPVDFHVHIQKVSQPTFPEVNKDFIQKVGITSGKYEDLIEKLKINLAQQFEESAKLTLKNKVYERLIAQNHFAIPNALLEEEKSRLRAEQFHLHEVDTDAASRTETLNKKAEWNVRVSLLLAALLKQNPMKPDSKRVEAQLAKAASLYRDPEAFIESYKNDPQKMALIEMLVLEDQVIESLLKNR